MVRDSELKKITNDKETVYIYDAGGKLIAEYSTDPNQNKETTYLTNDILGTPRVITDKFGDVVSRRDFMPFGEELIGTSNRQPIQSYSPLNDQVRQGFTGYENDAETGLDFAEARYYNSSHGRFTAVDPLLASGKSANPQTFNRYSYVGNNPIIRVDPTGLEWYIKNGTNQPEWFDDDPGDGYEKASHIYWAGDENGWVVLDYDSDSWQSGYETCEDAVEGYDLPMVWSLSDGVTEMMDVFDIVTIGVGTIRFGVRKGIGKILKEGGELLIEKGGVQLLRDAAKKELRDAGKKVTKIAINRLVGRKAELLVKTALEKKGYTILGSQVGVRSEKGLRFIDHLVKTPGGEIIAVEVKSGKATRNALQVTKDGLMESKGAKIIGNNAPEALKGTMRKIKTIVLTVK